MQIIGKRFNFVIQLSKYLSQHFLHVVIFPILSGYSLWLYFYHSHSVSLRSYFSYLKKNYGGLFDAVHKLFDEISPSNIGILKSIFMRGHHFKLQFFGQLMRENCPTVKWDSWLLGVLNMVGKSLGKLYPTNLKIIIQRLLLLLSYTESL